MTAAEASATVPAHGDAPGTTRGFHRERRAGVEPCLACREAHRAARRAGKPLERHRDELDPIQVERALYGDRVPLSLAERIEAVRRLNREGLTDPQIADRLHVSDRCVLRLRHRAGIPPVRAYRHLGAA